MRRTAKDSDELSPVFFEEKLDAETFDSTMIEDLFFKQKVRVTKKNDNRLATSNRDDTVSDMAGQSEDDDDDQAIRTESVLTKTSRSGLIA